LPDRASFSAKKRKRRRAWLSQVAPGRVDSREHGATWLCAQSIITGIRLYGRRLTIDYLAQESGLGAQQVMAALYELRNGGHLAWSRRGPIFYFDPKMRATARR
jgi:hypothetical protein